MFYIFDVLYFVHSHFDFRDCYTPIYDCDKSA